MYGEAAFTGGRGCVRWERVVGYSAATRALLMRATILSTSNAAAPFTSFMYFSSRRI
jgi:hypothetical protein